MSSKKVIVAVTARPSYSRIRTALEALRDRPDIDLSILCSGSALLSRYGRVADLIKRDGFTIVDELYTFVEGDELINMAQTAAGTIEQTAAILRREAPDVVVTVADRYETIGTAIAASYLGIPLVHVQGGEITGNIDEKVRHAITKLSDLHLVSTDLAAERVVRMGEAPASVVMTGCPSIDIAREAAAISSDDVQSALTAVGAGETIDVRGNYIVVLQHPETEAHEDAFDQMTMLLKAVTAAGHPVVLFWPNVDAGSDGTSKAIRVFREHGPETPMMFVKNLEGHAFLALLAGARALIGNSSVGIRECAYMGVPVVNIGQRQIGRERGPNVVDAPWDFEALTQAVAHQVSHGRYPQDQVYGDGHAGVRIAACIAETAMSTSKRFHDG